MLIRREKGQNSWQWLLLVVLGTCLLVEEISGANLNLSNRKKRSEGSEESEDDDYVDVDDPVLGMDDPEIHHHHIHQTRGESPKDEAKFLPKDHEDKAAEISEGSEEDEEDNDYDPDSSIDSETNPLGRSSNDDNHHHHHHHHDPDTVHMPVHKSVGSTSLSNGATSNEERTKDADSFLTGGNGGDNDSAFHVWLGAGIVAILIVLAIAVMIILNNMHKRKYGPVST